LPALAGDSKKSLSNRPFHAPLAAPPDPRADFFARFDDEAARQMLDLKGAFFSCSEAGVIGDKRVSVA
jgi:hypothetical protein